MLLCPTAVHFPTTAQPTALPWSLAKGVPCLSTPAGSEDPKAAAVVCVMGAPIVRISPPSNTAFHVRQDTSAPRVLQIIPHFTLIFVISWLTLNRIWIYFIQTGTDHYKSNPCPFGYACLMGSTKPMPCPPGSFGNLTNSESLSNCHPCPAGTFNHLAAQKACFPCGSSSTSPSGWIPSDI